MPAYSAYLVFAVVYLIIMIVKVFIIQGLVGFPPKLFFNSVVGPIAITTIVSFIVPTILFFSMDKTIIRTIVVSTVSVVSVAVSTYFVGLTTQEKNFAVSQIKKFVPINKINKR